MTRVLLLALAVLAVPFTAARAERDAATAAAVCPGATYIEVSADRKLVRCWAPDAFQYTFEFPSTPEKVEYAKKRWTSGVEKARECRKNGQGWQPTANGVGIECISGTISG